MSRVTPEHEPPILPQNPWPRPAPVPDGRVAGLYARAAASSSTGSAPAAASTSCGSHDDSGACEKYYNASGSDTTLPIVLGVVIPLGVAFIVLIVLHRRHVRRLRREDADDRHKSLDFGLGDGPSRRAKKEKKKGGRHAAADQTPMAEKDRDFGRKIRGLSMDLGLNNPYILPPQLQHSRESLHSLSRSINMGDDKYRATNFIPDDGSIRPGSSIRSPLDDSSSYTASSSRRFHLDSKQNLLHPVPSNSAPHPATAPALALPPAPSAPIDSQAPPRPPPPAATGTGFLAPTTMDASRDSYVSTDSFGPMNVLRGSNNYLGQFISGGTTRPDEAAAKKEPTATVTEIPNDTPDAALQIPPPVMFKDAPPPSPSLAPPPALRPNPPSRADEAPCPPPKESPPRRPDLPRDAREPRLPQLSFLDAHGLHASALELESTSQSQTATSTSNNTPLHSTAASTDLTQPDLTGPRVPHDAHRPGEDDADDYYDEHELYGDSGPPPHPESYGYPDYADYEYYDGAGRYGPGGYDPRRSTMGMRPLPPDDPSENPEQRANRIRSFYKEYFDESKQQGPRPEAPYYDGAEQYHAGYPDGYPPDGYPLGEHYPGEYYPGEYHGGAGHDAPWGPAPGPRYGRHRATVSNGSFGSPRAYSSISGRYSNQSRMPPRKRQPPPKPLNLLPTPHLLKDDTMLPMDFAPPKKFQNQRSGTPDSLRGGVQPYARPARAHVPLASSFDDLAAIPSPHQLRKSSTFTALDFAPPPRLRGGETSSDAGSIRSTRSGVSAVHLHNIRTGAYRVSRLPKEVAGTKDELTEALRPQWDMVR